MNEVENAEVREALHEFHQYLSDQLAPLLARDAMSVLLTCSPTLMASAIQAWLRGQLSTQREAVPVSDYLFHAMSKVHAFGELDLVEQQTLRNFLTDLAQEIVSFCPESDRELLRASIVALGESHRDATETAVQLLHRQSRPNAGTAQAGAVSTAAARELRRLELLATRLSQAIDTSGSPAPQPIDKRRELVTEVVAAAAASSSNGEELRQHLARLQQMGVPAEMDELFNALSDSLPGWNLSTLNGSHGTATASASLPSSSALHAMRKIVSLASDDGEASNRFRDLVHAGIRQFNEGVLARAAVIFDLAGHLVKEKAVSPPSIEAVQGRAHELLDPERLRKLAEGPEHHGELRRVLTFFPRRRPEGLLDDLQTEEHRDRRRLLLALLESHGEPARIACMERLADAVSGGAEGEAALRRDLIHVLRVVPPVDDTVEHEIELVASISPQNEEEVLVEAIGYLGERKHDKAVSALLAYLRVFEEMLVGGVAGGIDRRPQVIALLNRTVSTLARMGIADATVAALEHGLKDVPELGNTRARLVALGTQDLSQYPELVARALSSLRAALPGKLIGRFVKTKEDTIGHLITALSGTPSREVKSAFADLAKRFADKRFGEAAKKTLASFDDQAPPPRARSASLSGDLDLFGLPNVLQSLNGVEASGTLTLFDRNENVLGTIRFVHGSVGSCQTGMLRREAAVYQLFEKPSPGTFAFRAEADVDAPEDEAPGWDVMGLIMEGIRRYDEFQRASALVPDDAVLASAGNGASPVEDEPNEALVESVWERAIAGASPSELDQELPVDSYRVRRLLAQWVEHGSLCHAAARAD